MSDRLAEDGLNDRQRPKIGVTPREKVRLALPPCFCRRRLTAAIPFAGFGPPYNGHGLGRRVLRFQTSQDRARQLDSLRHGQKSTLVAESKHRNCT